MQKKALNAGRCPLFNADGAASSEILTADQAKTKADAEYYLEESFKDGSGVELLTMLFGNGSAIKITFSGDKIVTINGVNVREVLMSTAE